MINMNELMKEKLIKQDRLVKYTNLPKRIVAKTKLIKDCIIYDNEGILKESDVDYNVVIKRYGDKTGFEVACNDISIDKNKLDVSQMIAFLSELNRELVKTYNRKMVLYIQDKEDYYQLRFHTFWDDESIWLVEDLNVYDIPIMCYIAEEI